MVVGCWLKTKSTQISWEVYDVLRRILFYHKRYVPIDKHDLLNCGLPRKKHISINMTELSNENPSHFFLKTIRSDQISLSRVRLFATPWIAACQASLSITNSRSSPRLTPIELDCIFKYFYLTYCLFLLLSIWLCFSYTFSSLTGASWFSSYAMVFFLIY